MHIHHPKNLSAFLLANGAGPRKHLSQNFLIDGNVINKILSLAAVEPQLDCVIEIGPGPGALTQQLRKVAAHLTTIETDPLFAKEIERFNPDLILEEDVLKVNFIELVEKIQTEVKYKVDIDPITSKLHIISNLPYHLSTQILTQLLPLAPSIDSLTLMVQDEFAQRLIGSNIGTKLHCPLAVMRSLYAECTGSFLVKPTSFYPRPKVRSRVLHLKLKEPSLLPLHLASKFMAFCHQVFDRRRKMLRSTLVTYRAQANEREFEKMLEQFGTKRPEALCAEELATIFLCLERASIR